MDLLAAYPTPTMIIQSNVSRGPLKGIARLEHGLHSLPFAGIARYKKLIFIIRKFP
jgi:hypothetical protein